MRQSLGEGLGEDDERAADPPSWTVEPWADPVDGAALADELVDVFTRHIVLPPSGAEAIALWILHAWCIDAAGHSPLLVLLSPERRCGKSSVLILLLWLCPRSEPASSISPSAIFRFIEMSCPTLLIDELDNAIDDNRDLLAILNGGHNRAMAHVLRSVGDGTDFTPRRFSAWSPKALGTIKILPGTLADRAIIIPMSRKRPGDVVARVLSTDNAQFARLRSQCLRWSEDHAAELTGADPHLPKALDDRAADNWRPLKAIADVLGDRWSKLCSDAAEVLSRERGEDETTGVALLLALKAIFADARRGDLRPAGQAGRQGDAHGQHPAEAARRRRPLEGIRTLGEADHRQGPRPAAEGIPDQADGDPHRRDEKRGYRVADFDDAFSRYCPSSGCDFCGEGDRADDPLLTSYDGETSVLLHRSCWPSWAAAAGR